MTSYAMILLVIINLIAGTLGQQIILKDPIFITQCSEGLVNDKDKIGLDLTFGPNISYLTSGGWKLYSSLQILKKNSTEFEEICRILIGADGNFCKPSKKLCHCDHVDASGTAHVVVKYLASSKHSQGIVRAVWPHNNNTSLHSDKNITLPSIYDPENATVKLKVNGKATTIGRNGSCSVSLLVETNNTIQLCCYGTAEPCYVTLNFNGTIETVKECVTITGIIPNIYFTSSVHLHYSVCSSNEFIPWASCTINTQKQTNSNDNSNLIIILAVIIPIAMFCGIIAYVFYKKRKDEKEKNCNCNGYRPSNNNMDISSEEPQTRPNDALPKDDETADKIPVSLPASKSRNPEFDRLKTSLLSKVEDDADFPSISVNSPPVSSPRLE